MPILLSGSGWSATIADDGSATVTGPVPNTLWSFPVFKPARNPDVDPDFTEEPQIREITFGDGYSQRTRRGLNHIQRSLRLSWGLLPAAEEAAIRAFFQARGGVEPFWYGLPGKPLWRWRCARWGGGERHYGVERLRAELLGVVDPGA